VDARRAYQSLLQGVPVDDRWRYYFKLEEIRRVVRYRHMPAAWLHLDFNQLWPLVNQLAAAGQPPPSKPLTDDDASPPPSPAGDAAPEPAFPGARESLAARRTRLIKEGLPAHVIDTILARYVRHV